MSYKLDIHEAEAVLTLKGANEAAWNILIAYFERRYNSASKKCVVTRVDAVQIEQGIARAFDEIKNIEETADEVYAANKNT